MHAVISTGGKQYRVTEGDTVRVEKLDAAVGDTVEFDKVLLVSDGDDIKIGKPYIEGGKVTATVAEAGRGPKITIVKFRRRKHSRRKQGHRQSFTDVKVTGIQAG